MNDAQIAQEFSKRLARECDEAMTLVDTLLEEQGCLIRMETDRLSQLAASKEAQMFNLEKSFRNNLQQAVNAGYAESTEGFEAWIDYLNQFKPGLTSTFQTLKSSLLNAQRLNVGNGELVEQQLMSLQTRISILTAASVGHEGQKKAETYGPKGGLSTGQTGLKPRAVIR